ncbi:hypothetical protein [Mesorhizobium loti]|uniref:Glycosyltransferase n=1 Tax=Rhizobium loti TaxID=381 RepID=A0A1A5QQS1_RHILI|nr:hypothetical protein [Mesorhizobium loti]OBP78019.1 hypothetical protein BAE39_30760 [Mesorhizobium loti]OBQ70058.1 hypothetical protein A8145_28875 [Mesorhizobium loti]QKC73143.1 hypothetical protein EB815_31280 [Mesorhizobium loti]
MARLREGSLVIMFLHQFFQFSLGDFGVSNEALIIVVAVSGPLAIYLVLKISAWLSPWFLGNGGRAQGRLIGQLRNGVAWRVAKYEQEATGFVKPYIALALIALRWRLRRKARPHGLAGDLIVSLTSYPARFPTLHLTLRCLLSQTVAPDRVILWIAVEDAAQLPAEVTDLKRQGLEIRLCRDLRSYKKIIPALLAFPKTYIVTADDDVYYSRTWLEELVEGAGEKTVVCQRAHSVALDDAERIQPYSKWSYDVAEPAGMIFPTGVGGVLYGPKALSPEVVDEDMFAKLCPQGDDIWLFWMGRRVGSTYIKTNRKWVEFQWKGSQSSALHLSNVGAGGNDEQIGRMMSHYGLPAAKGLSPDELKRLPFSAEEMVARIQKEIDEKGILTADESRLLWTQSSERPSK